MWSEKNDASGLLPSSINDEDERIKHIRTAWSSCWDEDDSDDEAVKSDSFSEDHQKNHGNQNVVVLVSFDTSFATDSDGKARGEGWEADTESTTKVLVAIEVGVLPLGWVRPELNGRLIDYIVGRE